MAIPNAFVFWRSRKVTALTRCAALDSGLVDIGENYAQELVAKAVELADESPRWHFIGQVQRNKVRQVAHLVHLWQSVDRLRLGEEIAKRSPGASVLVEVNLTEDPGRGGARHRVSYPASSTDCATSVSESAA